MDYILKMVIFHGYVKWPEGICIYKYNVTFALFGDGKTARICGTWYASEIVITRFFWVIVSGIKANRWWLDKYKHIYIYVICMCSYIDIRTHFACQVNRISFSDVHIHPWNNLDCWQSAATGKKGWVFHRPLRIHTRTEHPSGTRRWIHA